MSCTALRDSISPSMLNALYPYASPGGNILIKIHPASYGLLITGAIAIFRVISGADHRGVAFVVSSVLLFFSVMFVFGLMAINGQTTSAGYLVDSILVYIFGLFAVLRLSSRQQLA